MIRNSWYALLSIGLLWSAAGFADDVPTARTDGDAITVMTLSVEMMLAESEFPSHSRPSDSASVTAYSNDWLRPIADLDVQDADALSRFSKIRSLSLLTLAEFGHTRLFLGVNEEGLVGLHFDAFSRYRSERSLEVVRMPYLVEPRPAAE